jgi:hypothetical protein
LGRLIIALPPRQTALFWHDPQIESALVPVLENEISPVRGPFPATSPKHFVKPRPIRRGLHDCRIINYGIILSKSKNLSVGRKSEGKRPAPPLVVVDRENFSRKGSILACRAYVVSNSIDDAGCRRTKPGIFNEDRPDPVRRSTRDRLHPKRAGLETYSIGEHTICYLELDAYFIRDHVICYQ